MSCSLPAKEIEANKLCRPKKCWRVARRNGIIQAQIRYVNEALDRDVRHHKPVIDIANSSTPLSDSVFHEERTKFIHILKLGKKLMYPNGIILQIIR